MPSGGIVCWLREGRRGVGTMCCGSGPKTWRAEVSVCERTGRQMPPWLHGCNSSAASPALRQSPPINVRER